MQPRQLDLEIGCRVPVDIALDDCHASDLVPRDAVRDYASVLSTHKSEGLVAATRSVRVDRREIEQIAVSQEVGICLEVRDDVPRAGRRTGVADCVEIENIITQAPGQRVLARAPGQCVVAAASTDRVATRRPLSVATAVAVGNGPRVHGALQGLDLQRRDLSIPGREVVQVIVEIAPGKTSSRHTHPGEEIVYVLEGSLEYRLEGKQPVILKAGDVLFIPAGAIHAARNVGSGRGAELATYIVEKDKPLLTEVE